MKQFKLTLLLTVLMSMLGLQAFADWDGSTKIHEGDLYYYLDNVNLQAQVTSMPSGKYTGDIMIPSTFTYNETNYIVTSIGNSAFFDCYKLTSVTIGNSVTTIGKTAFHGCSGLTSVTIPNSVKSIGQRAFSGCSGLTSVTIGNSVTSIGNYAFRGCSGLTSVTIPNSVKSIGGYAFYNCSGLTSVTIGNSVTSIGTSAFNGCTDLTSVTIGNSVTSIGTSAFSGCKSLTSVTIPNSVKIIDGSAFDGCSSLSSVTIGTSVTSIGDRAFYGCYKLTSVTALNPNPVAITGNVFTNLRGATLYVPKGSKTAYQAADYWKGFKEIIEIPNITFADANVEALCVANWDTNGDGELSEAEAAAVTDLGEVFKNNSTITSFNELRYFTGLTSIGGLAFYNCSALTSVTIPNRVTSIGNYAFNGCSGLTSVTIPNSVTSIGDWAFDDCTALTSVTIPNSVTEIGFSAFYNCSALTSVTIGNSVTSIERYAFRGCSGLTSVTIGNSVTRIGYGAFIGCSGLTSIIVASGNTKYDSRNNCNAIIETASNTLLYGCKKTTIPNSVTSIGSSAFYNCSGLTSVTIPNSVTSIGDWAFYGCKGLTSVTIGNSVTTIGNMAFEWTGLTSVTIPNSVTSIGDKAFDDCTALTSVTLNSNAIVSKENSSSIRIKSIFGMQVPEYIIGDDVTSIGARVFDGCTGLSSVIIPSSVTSIGESAFSGCSSLTSVTIPNSVTSIGSDAFKNTAWYNNQLDGLVYAGKVAYKYKGTMPANTVISILEGTLGIAGSAFYICYGLTSVTIGNSVTSIGDNAFRYCSGLTSVTALNPTPVAITQYVFTNRTNATLYVPKGSKTAYQAADYWKEFKEIVEIDVTGIKAVENEQIAGSDETGNWYTLDGRRLSGKPTKRGIYIVNGRKVIVN